ncbi:DNA ligase D [Segetibacter sp. 3557_3]|uniref:DNA ligase D n=1 Tax=Segetibacter sp. 3557_3 TaxID=2547429 RepID=UPI0010586F4A|nr:DNA ligase D [Segetibacter sp. 3557_3]TDH29126.1 DNA ligase D [Segetibacter sp. 3557_3]
MAQTTEIRFKKKSPPIVPEPAPPAKATKTKAKDSRKLDDYVPAMLAKETDQPFSDADWLFEIKWDGYRAIAELGSKGLQLYSRNGNSFLDKYPEVVQELKKWDVEAVVDGEIVVFNEEGNPEFQKLQHFDENRHLPILYYVFDLLRLNGNDLYSMPLIQRKELLRDIFIESQVIKYSDHVLEEGESFFEVAKEKDLEGVIAKKSESLYYPGKRTNEWLKIKHHKSDEAIICGFTAPRGGRKYFGALVLGMMQDGKLEYIGHTGSGFDQENLKMMWDKLQPLIQEASPFAERVKTNMPVTWVKPVLVAEMKFAEITSDGKMRHPIFLRLREDKSPNEATMNDKQVPSRLVGQQPAKATKSNDKSNASAVAPVPPKKLKAAKSTSEETAKPAKKTTPKATKPVKAATEVAAKTKEKSVTETADPASENAGNKIPVAEPPDEKTNDKIITFGKIKFKTTNRQKIFFPDEGVTKGDVIDYYINMGEFILPYLKDRPESLMRTPNGINSKGFFHKDAGNEAPDFVKSIGLYSDSAKKTIDYILCNNQATLTYMNNMGCIEINPWHSTVKNLDNPDYMIIDIDPSDNNTFDHVVEAALTVKQILDKAGAYSICKTSGASGLHVYVPMGKKYTYEQVKDFAYLICMLASEELPEITTLERSLSKRSKDKIYMDYLQNRKGQTIACVYSMRPKKGATVSTPLRWEEVKPGLSPLDFTFQTVPKRVAEIGDIFGDIFKKPADLMTCLANLEQQ